MELIKFTRNLSLLLLGTTVLYWVLVFLIETFYEHRTLSKLVDKALAAFRKGGKLCLEVLRRKKEK